MNDIPHLLKEDTYRATVEKRKRRNGTKKKNQNHQKQNQKKEKTEERREKRNDLSNPVNQVTFHPFQNEPSRIQAMETQ